MKDFGKQEIRSIFGLESDHVGPLQVYLIYLANCKLASYLGFEIERKANRNYL